MKRGCAALALAAALSGCGYTNQISLPGDIRTIHVEPVANAIDLTGEISQDQTFRVYRPGVEVELTNAIINRYIFDGHLQVVSVPDRADAVVRARLVDYRRDPLRYSRSDDVQEYRLSITLDVSVESRDGKPIWHESALTGDTTFFFSGARAISEDEAAAKAVQDTARRVVEKTLEIW